MTTLSGFVIARPSRARRPQSRQIRPFISIRKLVSVPRKTDSTALRGGFEWQRVTVTTHTEGQIGDQSVPAAETNLPGVVDCEGPRTTRLLQRLSGALSKRETRGIHTGKVTLDENVTVPPSPTAHMKVSSSSRYEIGLLAAPDGRSCDEGCNDTIEAPERSIFSFLSSCKTCDN